jgi:hypothetical protein
MGLTSLMRCFLSWRCVFVHLPLTFACDNVPSPFYVQHEFAETVSDPLLNAWRFNYGDENADYCSWQFGATQTIPDNVFYNILVGSKKYLIQQNWANRLPRG